MARNQEKAQMLMNRCDLHTILRLPTGIFYAQGVKTNVLFFTRSEDEAPAVDATQAVWIYDMRTGAPAYGKTNPIREADFADFVTAFGDDPEGGSPRTDHGEAGRFRCFTREVLAADNDNLDITWLKAESADPEDGLTDPEDIAAAIETHLMFALDEVRGLVEELGTKTRATAPEEVEA